MNPLDKQHDPTHLPERQGVKADGTVVMACSKTRVGMNELTEHMKAQGYTKAAYINGGVSEYGEKGKPSKGETHSS